MPEVGAAATPDSGLPALAARCAGVLLSPQRTLSAVAAEPRWLGVLVLTACVSAACAGAFASTAVGQQAVLDQQVRTLESFGQIVTDQQYARLQALDRYAAPLDAIEALAGITLTALLGSAVLFGIFNGLLGGKARFRQMFAVVAHAGVIAALQPVVLLPLAYIRQSLASPANFSAVFPVFDQGTFGASLLSSLDLFRLWWLAVVAIGVGVVYRRRIGPVFLSLAGVYVLAGVIVAAVQAILGGA